MAIQRIASQSGFDKDLTNHGVEQTYRDAVDLAKRMRAYLLTKAPAQKATLPLASKALFSIETLQISSRVMHVIAWGLAQKAVAAGELSCEEAVSANYRLADQDHFFGRHSEELSGMPLTVQEMAAQSQALYSRAQRLDRLRYATEHGSISVHDMMNSLVRTVR